MRADAKRTARPLVVGVGNRERGDDAIGPIAALDFAERWPDAADILLAQGDLSDLVLRWRHDQSVVLVDAVVSGRPPGTIVEIDGLDPELTAHETAHERLVSSHGVGVASVLALANLLDRRPGRLTVIGVEADQCRHFSPLSAPVADALPEVIERIRGAIRRHSVCRG